MRYTVKSDVLSLDPQLRFGIIIGKGLKNTESTAQDTARRRASEDFIKQIIKPEFEF